MKLKDDDTMMKFNLQYFAEPDPEEDETDPEDDPKGSDQDEPVVKIAEMKRRLSQKDDDYQKQIEKLQREQDEKIQAAIEAYEEKSKLSADELAEYKQKEAEEKYQKELEAKQKEIEELTRINQQRQIKDESVSKLNELNIPVNETTLSLVDAESLEGMAERAALLAQFSSTLKNELGASTQPIVGGKRAGAAEKDIRQKLDDARLI